MPRLITGRATTFDRRDLETHARMFVALAGALIAPRLRRRPGGERRGCRGAGGVARGVARGTHVAGPRTRLRPALRTVSAPGAAPREWWNTQALGGTLAGLGLAYLRDQSFALSTPWLLAIGLAAALWTPWLRREDADRVLVRMMVLGESPAPFERVFQSGRWRVYRRVE